MTRAATEPMVMGAAPLLAGAEVPVEADDDVPEAPELAVDVARVEPPVTDALPEGDTSELAMVSEGSVTDEPALPVPAGGVVSALLTVGTDAAGVTWIWPSEYWDTGARVDVAALALVVMLAQGVVPTWTWPARGETMRQQREWMSRGPTSTTYHQRFEKPGRQECQWWWFGPEAGRRSGRSQWWW